MYLFFDTETTGKFNFDLPATDPSQPRIISLAAVLTDEQFNVRESFSKLVSPVDFQVPVEIQQINGLSHDICIKYGLPLQGVLQAFHNMADNASFMVAFNIAFDAKMLNREGVASMPLVQKCAMLASTPVCKLPSVRGRSGYKWPKLEQAYQMIVGKTLWNAHDALADTLATVELTKVLVTTGQWDIRREG